MYISNSNYHNNLQAQKHTITSPNLEKGKTLALYKYYIQITHAANTKASITDTNDNNLTAKYPKFKLSTPQNSKR